MGKPDSLATTHAPQELPADDMIPLGSTARTSSGCKSTPRLPPRELPSQDVRGLRCFIVYCLFIILIILDVLGLRFRSSPDSPYLDGTGVETSGVRSRVRRILAMPIRGRGYFFVHMAHFQLGSFLIGLVSSRAQI